MKWQYPTPVGSTQAEGTKPLSVSQELPVSARCRLSNLPRSPVLSYCSSFKNHQQYPVAFYTKKLGLCQCWVHEKVVFDAGAFHHPVYILFQ